MASRAVSTVTVAARYCACASSWSGSLGLDGEDFACRRRSAHSQYHHEHRRHNRTPRTCFRLSCTARLRSRCAAYSSSGMFARALRRLYLPSFFTWCASCPGVAGGEREFSRDEDDGEEDVGD